MRSHRGNNQVSYIRQHSYYQKYGGIIIRKHIISQYSVRDGQLQYYVYLVLASNSVMTVGLALTLNASRSVISRHEALRLFQRTTPLYNGLFLKPIVLDRGYSKRPVFVDLVIRPQTKGCWKVRPRSEGECVPPYRYLCIRRRSCMSKRIARWSMSASLWRSFI